MAYSAPTSDGDFDIDLADRFNITVSGGNASVAGSEFTITSGLLAPPDGFRIELKQSFSYLLSNMVNGRSLDILLVTSAGDYAEFLTAQYQCSQYPAYCNANHTAGWNEMQGFYVAGGSSPDYFRLPLTWSGQTVTNWYLHAYYNYLRPLVFSLKLRSNQFGPSAFWENFVRTQEVTE